MTDIDGMISRLRNRGVLDPFNTEVAEEILSLREQLEMQRYENGKLYDVAKKRAIEAFARAWHKRDGLAMPWDQCPEEYKDQRREAAIASFIAAFMP